MPRCGPRLVGMVLATLAISGCSTLQEATAPTPTASAAQAATAAATPNGFGGDWNEDLALSGALSGRIGEVSASQPRQASACTGKHSSPAGQRALPVFGHVGPQVLGAGVH